MSLIKTPHAAVIVWNYEERLSSQGFTAASISATKVSEIIISTISLISISTSKTKSDPVGTFNLTLAPTRNWTAVLTPGSWCAILMSNESIDAGSLEKAKATQLKMIGRIDAVRTTTSVDDNGTRSTVYDVQGRDWGSIFENIVYVDPMLQDPSSTGSTQAAAAYQQIAASAFDANKSLNFLSVPKNLYTIMSVLGHPLKAPETDRLFKATHEITLPEDVVSFLLSTRIGFTSTKFMELLKLIWGPLKKDGEDNYDKSQPTLTGIGWLDASSLLGQRSLWDIIKENCNHAMNDLFLEMHWKGDVPEFRLYCRVKPFSYTEEPTSDKINTEMRSMLQNVTSHLLDTDAVVNVSAGVNWADKFNFLEIKPNLSEWGAGLGTMIKNKSQVFQGNNRSSDVFDREGFRPLIFSVKQLPFNVEAEKRVLDPLLLQKWVHLAQEWYFDCHKFLNGTVMLYGSNEYIPVGDNIMFDASLIGVTKNYNSKTKNESTVFVLAHVESVKNSFSVSPNGERSFQTTVSFVRGIIVNKSKQLIGSGTIDNLASALNKDDSKNSTTVYSSEDE